MPKAVLAGLKKESVKISVICAMLDSGGSSGRLRKDYNIVSPGDIRRALIALANTSPAVEALFDYRFEIGELKGHNFANLLITALELSTNDYEETINEIKKLLKVKHQVFPVTLDKSTLCAELKNGQIVKGETNIDRPKHNGNLEISRIYLEPEPTAYPKAVQAIKEADLITIGPGDLYSSLAQILLVKRVAPNILESGAKTVYLCNLMTKYGETNHFTVRDFSDRIEAWLGGELDIVLYNNCFPSPDRIKSYKEKHPELLQMVEIDQDLPCSKFLGRDLIFDQGPLEHDPKKTTKALMDIL